MAESIMGMGHSHTIAEYIANYKSEELVYSSYFLKQVVDPEAQRKMLVNFNNLVITYFPELKDLKLKVTLSNEEFAKYRYNPKRLSHDIYGTTELWFLIMEANELHSITQFNLQTLYLFRSDIVEKMLRVLNLERNSIDYNEEEVAAALLG